ncbi:Prpf4b [Symbiodinium natans]|uniref:Prpf4b protein n=1 Tax=Symbiodinium natans TaxID=878477 RepID=A0A812UVR2_9DINO|nr:Prpf4b [Symbiodinium natans]
MSKGSHADRRAQRQAMPATGSPSTKKKRSSSHDASTKVSKKKASRSRDDDKRRKAKSRSRNRSKDRERSRDRDKRRRRDGSDDSRRRRDNRRRQRASSSSSLPVRRRRSPDRRRSPERRRTRSPDRARERDRDRKARRKDSSSDDRKSKKSNKDNNFDKEVIDVRPGTEETNGDQKDRLARSSRFSPIEAHQVPLLNPYAKGSSEALRLDAARLEVARLKAMGKMPPPQLLKEVAVGAQAAAIAAPAKSPAVEKPKPKKTAPAPWMAARAVFANKDGEGSKASEPATPGSQEGKEAKDTKESKDGAKNIKKLGISELSELSKAIAEDRNKLRLFVVKAKADFEERKEKAKALHQAVQMGETDENEYYSASVGEEMGPNRCYKVEAAIGRGVFSSVYHCKGLKDGKDYAVKLIRANAMMRRAADKEVEMYKRLEKSSSEDAEGFKHVIILSDLQTFEHNGHLSLVFDLLKCDMRFALQKYGMGAGLPLPTLQQYVRQILLGLRALRAAKVVHADLKPDNILMTLNKAEIKICDFGSAMDASEQVKTAYLQPRYYRAPEIMLGVPYDMGIDMWSAGTTIYELATGKILFTGKTNNQMMNKMISVVGKFPERMWKVGEFARKHFNENGDFMSKDPDSITGLPDVVQLSKPTRTVLNLLQAELKHPNAGVERKDHEKWVVQLAELVGSCCRLDPQDRMKPGEAVELQFFKPSRDA